MKKVAYYLMISGALVFASCGGGTNENAGQDTPAKTEETAKDEHPNGGHEHPAAEAEETGMPQLAVPEGARVFFANLEDGQTVTSPFTVQFGIEGMEVEPAGEQNEGKGHHHIIINGSFIESGVIVPADETNIHFGKGQTETELTLDPGDYTLTMQFADGFHQSYGEQMSATIKVTVE